MTSRTMESLTAERLRELFEYNPETGQFIRKVTVRGGGSRAGDVAGYKNPFEGRILIRVDGHKYHANRLAWLYMTGEWPERMVDHEDTNTSNNAWANLRLCNFSQNKTNSGPQSNNKLGVKNVHRVRNGSFKASVGKAGVYHQKIFKDLESASAWADAKRKELHGEFARGEK